MRRDQQVRIALLEQFSGRNIGDTISLICLMDRLAAQLPGAVFDIYSYRGGEKRLPVTPHNVRFIDMMPWRLTVSYLGWPALRRLPEADLVVTRGGRFFSQRLFQPYFNHLLSFRVLFPWIKAMGKPILLFDIGIGPLRGTLARRWARTVLSLADMITYRDADSERCLHQLGVRAPFEACAADPVWLWQPKAAGAANRELEQIGVRTDERFAVINATSLVGFFVDHAISLATLESRLETLLDHLVTRYRIWLVPTQIGDISFCRQLAARHAKVSVFPSHDVSHAALMAFLGDAELMVSMRYHAAIMAMLAGCPTVAIAYAPKVSALMRENGLERFCVTADGLGNLTEVVERALAERGSMVQRQRTAVERLRTRAAATDVCFERFLEDWSP